MMKLITPFTWRNYGDVNFFKYGGRLIKWDGGLFRVIEVVALSECIEREVGYYLDDMLISGDDLLTKSGDFTYKALRAYGYVDGTPFQGKPQWEQICSALEGWWSEDRDTHAEVDAETAKASATKLSRLLRKWEVPADYVTQLEKDSKLRIAQPGFNSRTDIKTLERHLRTLKKGLGLAKKVADKPESVWQPITSLVDLAKAVEAGKTIKTTGISSVISKQG